jgi:hypothetical protein
MQEINKMRERKEIKGEMYGTEQGPECDILMSAYLGSSEQ